jgi:mannose-6-phosphate isomerase-like protein (cupin superfamily)
MKQFRLNQLTDVKEGHVLNQIMPGKYLNHGGLAFEAPGARAHTNDGPGGIDYHVHDDCEAFLILQGNGTVEINKEFHPFTVGDIIIIEPGEDHHVISSVENPAIIVWLHAGEEKNKNQRG